MVLSWRQMASLLGPPGPMAPQVAWLANPQAAERRILMRAPQALMLQRIEAVLSGGSSQSVSLTLRHGADVSTSGTAVSSAPLTISSANGGSTIGVVLSSFENPAVPKDHWLWLEVIAVSGSPAVLTVGVRFSQSGD